MSTGMRSYGEMKTMWSHVRYREFYFLIIFFVRVKKR